MLDHAGWSLNLGRWAGVQVRLHLLFLLFAVFTLFLAWKAGQGDDPAVFLWLAVIGLTVLVASVIVHELAHVVLALGLGGNHDEVVLVPWGGLTDPSVEGEPRRAIAAFLAGPAANLVVAALVGLALWLAGENVLGLLHPFAPAGLASTTTWLAVAKSVFWVNWMLVLVNLVPALPFDGGRVLRAGILALWPRWGLQRTAVVLSLLGRIAGFVLLVAAVFLWSVYPEALVPPWFAVALLGIFLLLGARQREYVPPLLTADDGERGEDALFGYDFSQGYTSLERSSEASDAPPPGPITMWFQQRQEAKLRRQREVEAEEERRVDDILARLHETGMQSLSEDDRALLQRVSARYRSRHGS
jgi:stage IV sporulation protein FB